MRLFRKLFRLLLLAILVIILIVVGSAAWIQYAAGDRVVSAQEIPESSTLLVLGALVTDGEPGDYVRGRLDTAVELYETGRVTRIVNSGNGDAGPLGEPAVMRNYLVRAGVPGDIIVDDPDGQTTDLSCRALPQLVGATSAGELGGPIVIITQDFHIDRAIALCRVAGVDNVRGVIAGCDCPTWTLVRNEFREALLSGPRAALTAVGSAILD